MKVFVSYARNDLVGGELERFLEELETDLRSSLGEKAEVLFRDLNNLRLGDDWKPGLEEALKTSSILLAICSPSFFKSVPCGKEFAIFLNRLAKARSAYPRIDYRAIFPVIWTPPLEEIPANVKRFQFDHADLPKNYAENGLRPLFRMSRFRDDSLTFTSVLAKSIIQTRTNPLPPSNEIAPFDQTASAFASRVAGGHSSQIREANLVTVFMAVGRKSELEAVRSIVGSYDNEGKRWRPFMPDSSLSISAEAQGVIAGEDLESVVLPLDQALCDKITAAEERNEIVVVLADPWTLQLQPYADQLKPFDKRLSANCAFIVVWNKEDQETIQKSGELESKLREIFFNKMAVPPPGHLFSGVDSRTGFLTEFKKALTEAKIRVIQVASRHRRADHAGLQQLASQAGISVTAPAVLQNAGGQQ